jgi:hypothetical protein
MPARKRIVEPVDGGTKNRSSTHRDSYKGGRGGRKHLRALSTSVLRPPEIRGIDLIEAIDEGWVTVTVAMDDGNEDWVKVGDDHNPVSQIALSNCQHKLRNDRVHLCWAEPHLGPALENHSSNLCCQIQWSLLQPICQLGVLIPLPKLIARHTRRCRRNTWALEERIREERR